MKFSINTKLSQPGITKKQLVLATDLTLSLFPQFRHLLLNDYQITIIDVDEFPAVDVADALWAKQAMSVLWSIDNPTLLHSQVPILSIVRNVVLDNDDIEIILLARCLAHICMYLSMDLVCTSDGFFYRGAWFTLCCSERPWMIELNQFELTIFQRFELNSKLIKAKIMASYHKVRAEIYPCVEDVLTKRCITTSPLRLLPLRFLPNGGDGWMDL